MQCHSCGSLVAPIADGYTVCAGCLEETGTDREFRSEPRPLVTDGGKEPDDGDDDPLAPTEAGDGDVAETNTDDGSVAETDDSETASEPGEVTDTGTDEENYIAPDEIVGDDIDDDSSESTEPPENQKTAESQGRDTSTDESTASTAADQSGKPAAGNQSGESAPGGGPGESASAGTSDESASAGTSDESASAGAPGASDTRQESRSEPSQQQGSQPGSYQQGETEPAGSTRTASNEGSEFIDQVQEFPLKLGAALGSIAFFVLYLLVTVASYWTYEESPTTDPEMGAFDVGAEVFLTIAGLGSGQRIVDFFIGMADVGVTRPGEVDPANYPTVENQLGPILSLLDSNPEVPLLILYIMAPYTLFVSARYLARHYAPSESNADRMLAGMTVALGTLPVVLLVGAVFETFALLERVLFVGIFIPAGIGALGGLSICYFDDQSAIVSTLVGWAAIGTGIAIAAVLLPLPDLAEGTELELSFLDHLVIGLGAYLNALEFNMGAHSQGRLYFLLVAVITIAAGFVRTWWVDDQFENRMDGALVGSSIWLGFFATVALFLWLFPMSTAFVDVSITSTGTTLVAGIEGDALGGLGTATISTIESVVSVNSYLHTIAVAGFIFPAMFGGIGGYLAAWYSERE